MREKKTKKLKPIKGKVSKTPGGVSLSATVRQYPLWDQCEKKMVEAQDPLLRTFDEQWKTRKRLDKVWNRKPRRRPPLIYRRRVLETLDVDPKVTAPQLRFKYRQEDAGEDPEVMLAVYENALKNEKYARKKSLRKLQTK